MNWDKLKRSANDLEDISSVIVRDYGSIISTLRSLRSYIVEPGLVRGIDYMIDTYSDLINSVQNVCNDEAIAIRDYLNKTKNGLDEIANSLRASANNIEKNLTS